MIIKEANANSYDLCIIGTGPAGLTVANEFLNSKLKVLIIDSSPSEYSDKKQSLNKGVNFNLHSDTNESIQNEDYFLRSRKRAFGGTSKVWAGYTRPINQNFWNKNWPFPYTEIDPFYTLAKKTLDINENYVSDYLDSNLLFNPFNLSPPTRFKEKFFSIIQKAKNVDCLLDNTITDINISNDEVLSFVSVDSKKNKKVLKAKKFILCCGSLENTRLLLNWSHKNDVLSSPHLGKNFNDHLYFELKNSFFLTEGHNHFKNTKKRISAFSLKNNFFHKITLQIEKESKDQSLAPKGLKGTLYDSAVILTPQEKRKNKVYLDSSVCELGLKQISINWQIDNIEYQKIRIFLKELDKNFNLLGMGKINQKRFALTSPEYGFLGYHPTGTTKMGKLKENSYVDTQLKVHSTSNLYVLSNSVFPSSSYANPTLTIVALAHRLSDHLKRRFKI